jgi:hypothetical protein
VIRKPRKAIKAMLMKTLVVKGPRVDTLDQIGLLEAQSRQHFGNLRYFACVIQCRCKGTGLDPNILLKHDQIMGFHNMWQVD